LATQVACISKSVKSKMACIYRHIRLDKNEPFYIGIGNTEQRAYSVKSRNKHWQNISKNGYDVEILMDDLSWGEACQKEIEFILLYGRKDLNTGCLSNMTNGGEGQLNRVISQETRYKLGNKRGIKESEESCLNKKIAAQKLKEEGRLTLKYGVSTKKVISIKTNKTWESAKICAIENNIKPEYLHKLLNGTIKNNKTEYRYYGNK
jgi:hypothetical protein